MSFNRNKLAVKSRWDWLMLSIALFMLLFAFYYYQSMNKQLATLDAQAKMVTQPSKSHHHPQLAARVEAAQNVQLALDKPWLTMLATLEKVKAQSPNIRLLSLTPSVEAQKIDIKGETSNFEDITDFIERLKTEPMFSEVFLFNQQLQTQVHPNRYVFQINMRWKI